MREVKVFERNLHLLESELLLYAVLAEEVKAVLDEDGCRCHVQAEAALQGLKDILDLGDRFCEFVREVLDGESGPLVDKCHDLVMDDLIGIVNKVICLNTPKICTTFRQKRTTLQIHWD